MCKTGFSIREDDSVCHACEADGSVTALADRTDESLALDFKICELCVETGAIALVTEMEEDLPILTYGEMATHVNRAVNVAVEQISARMIEYLDSMGEPRG